jgi:hypothetical protein
MSNHLEEETKDNIIRHLIIKIDVLKEDKRALYKVIEDAQQKIYKLKHIINDFTNLTVKPKFEIGDKVNIFLDSDTTYVIQDYMYEQSYPVYNIIPLGSTSEDDIETVSEMDLIKI